MEIGTVVIVALVAMLLGIVIGVFLVTPNIYRQRSLTVLPEPDSHQYQGGCGALMVFIIILLITIISLLLLNP